MKRFTMMMAGALLLGACSQQTDDYASYDSPETRGGIGNMVGFHKVVQTAQGTRPATEGEFTFELWGTNKPGTKSELLGTYSTDANGDVWVDFTNVKGQGRNYFFREIFHDPADQGKWELLSNLRFTVIANWGMNWAEFGKIPFNQGPTVVNASTGPVEPEVPTMTLANTDGEGAYVWPGTTDLCYVAFNRAQLENGQFVRLVSGDEHNWIADAFVLLQWDGSFYVLTDGVGTFGGFVTTELPAAGVDPLSELVYNEEVGDAFIECDPSVTTAGSDDMVYVFFHFKSFTL